jgi:quercetin dioxygenase-like cupin family protein
METFSLNQLLQTAAAHDRRYLEFLRKPSMSLGIYTLPAGASDGQSPHMQDEVYYVVRGKGNLRVESETQPAEPGAILFVAAGAKHKFIEIEEELTLLVFFAPAEG